MAIADGATGVRDAAVELFATKGFHGTGIRDLASAAGLSSASLYHYMGTKEELLTAIMRECLGNLLAAAKLTTVDIIDPAQRLSTLVALHVLTHARQPRETRVVDGELDALSAGARRQIVRLRDSYEHLWTTAITEGLHSGQFQVAQPSATRLALLEMCNGVAKWYSPRGRLSLEALATHYAQLARRALGCADTEPGTDADIPHAKAVVTQVWAGTR